MPDTRIPIFLGVTGHRDLPVEDVGILRASLRQFLGQLRRDYPNSPFKLISGLAEGADWLMAEVALESGIGLLAALPMPQADYEQDFESRQSLERFRDLVARAESCFVVSQDPDVACSETGRDLKYLALGRYIARHSQIVIALWDGVLEQTVADGRKKILTGGTADVVRLCRNGFLADTPVQIVTPEVTWVEHLWVRRQGKALPDGEVGQWANEIHINAATGYAQAKEKAHAVLRSIDKFNAYVSALTPTQIKQSHDWLVGKDPPQAVITCLTRPLGCFAAADAAAGQRQADRIKAIKWVSALAIASVICQLIYSGPDMRWGWLAAHIVLAVLAFIEYTRYFTRENPREQQYFDWRSLAETMRIQVFWLASGIGSPVADHYLSGDRNELDWIRQAARNTTIGVSPVSDPACMEWARDAWLESQRAYFQKKSPENGLKLRRFGRLATSFFLSGMAITVGTLAAHLMSVPGPALNLFVLASGICFLFSAVLKTYAGQMAFEEQMNRYHVMSETYRMALARFDGHLSQNEAHQAREVLRLIGKEALTENAGWLRLHRQRQFEVNVG